MNRYAASIDDVRQAELTSTTSIEVKPPADLKQKLQKNKDIDMQTQDWLGDIFSDPLALVMTGLGISFIPYSEYVGGLFLALACAAWARHFSPEKSRKEFWAVMMGGFIAAHLAVIAANIWVPEWKPQLVMALAGFFSRFAARFTLRLVDQLEDRADEIGDTVATKIKKTIE